MADKSGNLEHVMEEGEELARAGKPADALSKFKVAWELLPDPRDEQEEAVGVLAAIADCCFFLGRWSECCDAVQDAFRCGADVGNVFFRLRMGQALYELGNLKESANWLVPVYLMEGREPFDHHDPKYLESFRSQLKPPEGGWPEGW